MSTVVKIKKNNTKLEIYLNTIPRAGFASGDVARDALAVRNFAADGHNVLLAQSFAKVYLISYTLYLILFIYLIFTLNADWKPLYQMCETSVSWHNGGSQVEAPA